MGIPPEDVELAKRRLEALALIIVGVILVISGPFLCIATSTEYQTACGTRKEPNLGVFAATEIIGWIILLYGGYLWDKVKHIEWTKQALREYDTQRMRIQRELRERRARREPEFSEEVTTLHPVRITPVPESQCYICGLAFHESEKALKCPSCQNAFHEGCLESWIELNKNCPSCAKRLKIHYS